MSDLNAQIKRVEDRLLATVQDNFNKVVNEKLKRLQRELNELQNHFFNIMAGKVIGAEEAPSLGRYTPMWKPLSDDYTERRARDFGIDEEQFFLRSGAMGSVLSKLKPVNFLGKPLITYAKGDYTTGPQKNYNAPRRGQLNTKMKATITIDIFPNIKGSLEQDQTKIFRAVRVQETIGGKSKRTPLGYRLKNFRGANDRPFVTEYMNWWLNVQARALIKKVMR